jgi:hypothetical protein
MTDASRWFVTVGRLSRRLRRTHERSSRGAAWRSPPRTWRRGVTVRMERRTAVLGRERPPKLHFVVGPDVLLREVGSREVLQAQVAHMLDLVERGVVTIHVLPWGAGAAPVQLPFTVMEFEQQEDPEIASCEIPRGAKYIEDRTSWSTTGAAGPCSSSALDSTEGASDSVNENDLHWIKAARSADQGQCVEMAKGDETVHVRDSKDPGGPMLMFTRAEFAAWLHGAKRGEFDHLI